MRVFCILHAIVPNVQNLAKNWLNSQLVRIQSRLDEERPHIDDYADMQDDTMGFIVGDVVVLVNLLRQPDLNGRIGETTGWDEGRRRFQVLVDGATEAKLLKPGNLKMVDW